MNYLTFYLIIYLFVIIYVLILMKKKCSYAGVIFFGFLIALQYKVGVLAYFFLEKIGILKEISVAPLEYQLYMWIIYSFALIIGFVVIIRENTIPE